MSDEQSRRVPPVPDERRVDRFAIGHDAFQFKFDFWQSRDDQSSGVTRITTDPTLAKDLSQTLRESLRDYAREWRRLDCGPNDEST